MSTQYERMKEMLVHSHKDWPDLRKASGITRAGIKKWRDGDFKELTAANVFALADFLNCDARWLALGDRGQPGSGGFSQLHTIWSSVNDDGRREMLAHAAYVTSQPRFRPDQKPAVSVRA